MGAHGGMRQRSYCGKFVGFLNKFSTTSFVSEAGFLEPFFAHHVKKSSNTCNTPFKAGGANGKTFY